MTKNKAKKGKSKKTSTASKESKSKTKKTAKRLSVAELKKIRGGKTAVWNDNNL